MTLKRLLITIALASLLWARPGSAGADDEVKWTPDLVHSRADFRVFHMVLSQVWGHFPIREMHVTTSGTSLVPTSIYVMMDVQHLDTDNHTRDDDLRSATYFDTADYPMMTFRSTSIKRINADNFRLTGDLKVKNVTKSVTFPVHIIGHIPDSGGTRLGYEGSLVVDRRDFGITDDRLMSGVLFVGYSVNIGITAEISSALPFK